MQTVNFFRSRTRARPLLAAAFCLYALVASSWSIGAPQVENAEELLPVDCLLPGQVRRLGRQMTYVTQRRAIKTTGVDCAIRGGEYVSFDRANYATALGIWLPLARQGDAKAQNYVGEIHEKGLGVPSDPTAAAIWYRKAAQQKLKAAQINLGQLYEAGLGVEQNIEQALEWYRKAAGLQEKQLRFVSFDYSEQAFSSMKVRLSKQEKTIRDLVEKLDRSASNTRKLESKLQREKRKLAPQRKEITQRRLQLEQRAEEIAALEQHIEQERNGIDAKSLAKIAAFETEVAQLGQALLEKEQSLQQLTNALDSKTEQAQASGLQTTEELSWFAQFIISVAQQFDLELAKPSPLEAEIAAARTAIAAQQADIELGKNRLSERAQALNVFQQQLQSQKRTLADAQSEQDNERVEQERAVDTHRKIAESRRIAVESAEKRLSQYRITVAQLSGELAEKEQALSIREQDLASKTLALELARAQSKRLIEQVAKSRTDVVAQRAAQPVAALDAAPLIRMIEPKLLSTRGDFVVTTQSGLDQRTIIGQVISDSSIMSVLINGQDVPLDDKGFFQRRIALEQKHTPVSVVAVDERGQRGELSFSIEPEKKAAGQAEQAVARVPKEAIRAIQNFDFGHYHALVIGNQSYQHLPKLSTTLRDAEAVADLLKNKYQFQVTSLVDASRYDILSALNELRARLTDEDNLLIYYAGHGELDRVNNRGHWLPVDAEETSTANWISNIAITDILNAMNAKKVLVVADSCYSGAMTRSTLARLDAGRSDKAWQSWIKMLSEKHSRLSFSSGGLAPVLDGGGGRHSIFAKAFLDVLEDNQQILEGRSVHSRVAQAVSYAASAAQFEQAPQYAPIKYAGHEAGDFLFVPKKL